MILVKATKLLFISTLTSFLAISTSQITGNVITNNCYHDDLRIAYDGMLDSYNSSEADTTPTFPCSYSNLKTSYKNMLDSAKGQKVFPNCENDTDTILMELLGVNSTEALQTKVEETCYSAFREKTSSSPKSLEKILDKSSDFLKNYFDGGTYWNQADALPSIHDNSNRRLSDENSIQKNLRSGKNRELQNNNKPINRDLEKRDIKLLKRFMKSANKNNNQKSKIDQVAWPVTISNFDQCDLRTVMCCWVLGNEHHARSTDDDDDSTLSVTNDPTDNTDVCYVDMNRSPRSNHIDGGFSIFDNTDDEGSTYCHGFTWGSHQHDPTNIFKANNLFKIGIYDNLFVRGFSKNIPGAPMCGCIEKMPTVTRADCTQISFKKEKVNNMFDIDSNELDVKFLNAHLEYSECEGPLANSTDDDNDLSSYYDRLVMQGRATVQERESLRKYLVGDGNCTDAIDDFLFHHTSFQRQVTEYPSTSPSLSPSSFPSQYPSTFPSLSPSLSASSMPSQYPSTSPTS